MQPQPTLAELAREREARQAAARAAASRSSSAVVPTTGGSATRPIPSPWGPPPPPATAAAVAAAPAARASWWRGVPPPAPSPPRDADVQLALRLQQEEVAAARRAQALARPLAYGLPEFGVHMPFRPTDFTQVNPHINRVLVSRAVRLLDVQATDRVIDWFCGLGNFTLPLATRAREVLGIEGSEARVARSRQNLALNQTASRDGAALCPTQFAARNLFEMTPELLLRDGAADRWLVDPPREGAFALVKALAELHQNAELRREWTPPARIVYVSCNPATLARDAGLLVHQAGYRCSAAGVVNMFPHTAHVESIAVFDRDASAG